MRREFLRSVRKMSKVAIIGGSRFKELDNLIINHSTSVNTPYGEPSAPLSYGMLGDREVVYLPRRGSDTPMAPHNINYRANIWALRDAGVQTVIATAAVAGIFDQYYPGDLVIPNQLIDYTYGRENTFFGDDNEVNPIDFSEPYHEPLRKEILNKAQALDLKVHFGATYGITQGPRFETLAEIKRMQNDGCDMVGMTGMPEATLAREIELDYALVGIIVRQAGKSYLDKPHEQKVVAGEKQLAKLIESMIT